MTREKVTERLALLEQRFGQLASELQALNGAIADCRYWLSVYDGPEEEKKEETKESKPEEGA